MFANYRPNNTIWHDHGLVSRQRSSLISCLLDHRCYMGHWDKNGKYQTVRLLKSATSSRSKKNLDSQAGHLQTSCTAKDKYSTMRTRSFYGDLFTHCFNKQVWSDVAFPFHISWMWNCWFSCEHNTFPLIVWPCLCVIVSQRVCLTSSWRNFKGFHNHGSTRCL